LVLHRPDGWQASARVQGPAIVRHSDGSEVRLSVGSVASFEGGRVRLEQGRAEFVLKENCRVETPAGPVNMTAKAKATLEVSPSEEDSSMWMMVIAVAAGSAQMESFVVTPGMHRVFAMQDKPPQKDPGKKPAPDQEKKKEGDGAELHIKGRVTAVDEKSITVTSPAYSKDGHVVKEAKDYTFNLHEIKIVGGPAQVGMSAGVFFINGEPAYIRVGEHKEPEKKKDGGAPHKDGEEKKKGPPEFKSAVKGRILEVSKDGKTITIDVAGNDNTLTLNLGELKVEGPAPQAGFGVNVFYDFNDHPAMVRIFEPSPDGGKKEKKPGEPHKDGEKKKGGDPQHEFKSKVKGQITEISKDGTVLTILVNGKDDLTINISELKVEGPAPQVGYGVVVGYNEQKLPVAVWIYPPHEGDGKKPGDAPPQDQKE
jgi:hypothetical protein